MKHLKIGRNRRQRHNMTINGQDARRPHRLTTARPSYGGQDACATAMRLAPLKEMGRRFLLQVLRSEPEKHSRQD